MTHGDLEHVDWDEFRAIARHHRLAGVIYYVAKKSPQFPKHQVDFWRPALVQHGALNVRKRRQLLRMLFDLEERGVSATPFKGMVLAEALYSDPAVRPTTDFDLYIPFEAVTETVDYFISQDYHSPYFAQEIPDSILHKVYSIELFHPVRKDYIDIHWELTDGYALLPFSKNELVQRRGSLAFEDSTVPCFDATITAALIAVHGAKNSWDQLVSLLDLALFFRRHVDFDYADLAQRLHERGISRMLLVGAHLVDQLGLAKAPKVLLRFDSRSKSLAHRIAHRIVNDPMRSSPKRWAKAALNLRFRESLPAKASYILFKVQPKKVDVAGSSPEKASRAWLRRIIGMS